MRIIVALALLLLQAQPLVAAALCGSYAERAEADCPMAHEEGPAASTLIAPGAEVHSGCAGMTYCAPTPPAVPNVMTQFRLDPLVQGAAAPQQSLMAPTESLAPPFHPPRA